MSISLFSGIDKKKKRNACTPVLATCVARSTVETKLTERFTAYTNELTSRHHKVFYFAQSLEAFQKGYCIFRTTLR